MKQAMILDFNVKSGVGRLKVLGGETNLDYQEMWFTYRELKNNTKVKSGDTVNITTGVALGLEYVDSVVSRGE